MPFCRGIGRGRVKSTKGIYNQPRTGTILWQSLEDVLKASRTWVQCSQSSHRTRLVDMSWWAKSIANSTAIVNLVQGWGVRFEYQGQYGSKKLASHLCRINIMMGVCIFCEPFNYAVLFFERSCSWRLCTIQKSTWAKRSMINWSTYESDKAIFIYLSARTLAPSWSRWAPEIPITSCTFPLKLPEEISSGHWGRFCQR